MVKAIIKMFLFNLPFLLIGGGLIVWGYFTDERILTDDGLTSRRFFLYVMGGGAIGIGLIINTVILLLILRKRNQIKDIIAYGQPGTAKVLQLNDTGIRINNNPRVKLRLEISIPNYPTYQTEKTLNLSIVYLPRVQPGLTVKILADPTQPANENRIGLVLD